MPFTRHIGPQPIPTAEALAFEVQLDLIPPLVGYHLTDALVIVQVSSKDGLAAQVGPLTPEGVRAVFKARRNDHTNDPVALTVVAITETPTVHEEILRQTIHGLCDYLDDDATIGAEAQRIIAAGWASAREFAMLDSDWQLGPTHLRGTHDGNLGFRLPGRPLPAADQHSYLRRFKHTGQPVPTPDSTTLLEAKRAATDLLHLYTDTPGHAKLTANDRSVMLAGAADPHIQPLLLAMIDPANAPQWMRIWHGLAVHSSTDTFASAYALAAYVAWVQGDGMKADAYLTFAGRSSDPTKLVKAVATGLESGRWDERALARTLQHTEPR